MQIVSMIRFVITLVICCLSNIAFAESYIGISLNKALAVMEPSPALGGNESMNDISGAFGAYLGFPSNSNYAVEISYLGLGRYQEELTNGVDSANMSLSVEAMGVSLLGKASSAKETGFYVRGGIYRWNRTKRVTYVGSIYGSQDKNESDIGTDVFGGIGLDIKFENLALRLNADRYINAATNIAGNRSSILTVGLSVMMPI